MTIMTILCKIQNLDLSHARELRVDVASKTVVEFDNGKGVISIFNDTSHLKGI
jgi:broad specificity phosphatase PhoE